jgi:hypothetical protein
MLHIDETSWIDVSGRSTNTKGSSTKNNQGASYIASGGSCEDDSNGQRYSQFDLLPSSDVHDMRDM